MQTAISLILRNRSNEGLYSCHSVCTLLWNHNNRPVIEGQGPAVLAAGTGWKLFDFWGEYRFTYTRFCQEIFLAFFCNIQCKID